MRCWWRVLQVPWTAGKTDKKVLEQIQLETLLEAEITKLKLFYLQAHHEKAEFFGKDNNAGRNRRWREKRKTHYEMD